MASKLQVSDLTKGISEFASDFYQQCAQAKSGENVIISPLSVSSALALLSQGAGGNTFEELKKGLHLGLDKAAAANQFHDYYELLEKSVGKATLSIANQLYVQQGYQIKQKFQEVAVKKFRSGIESLNFANPAPSAQTINKFVEEKTKDKIKDLIKPAMLNSDTRLVSVNAIYFKGAWEYKFNKKMTLKKEFYISDAESRSVDFMRMKSNLNYATLPELDATALELKYVNSNFSMVIVLPNSRTGLAGLEERLKNYDLTNIFGEMYKEAIEISIPKFNIDFEINLNDVLKNMGMPEMFTPMADLSGLLEGHGPLYVSDVVHKAFIEVNEEGSEAAAAATVFNIAKSYPPKVCPLPHFKADHPFAYYIWDKTGSTPVFSGRLTTPSPNISRRRIKDSCNMQ